MSNTDEYGRIAVSTENPTPRKAWAYIELVEIDPNLIFAERKDAKTWATLQADLNPQIISVIVQGVDITRA